MRYAAKRLTRSDLTLFEFQYQTLDAGNQKSINLNSDVFIDRLFPEANDYAAGRKLLLPIDLRVFGPDAHPLHGMPQTISSKHASQKNWRLGGGTIRNPPDGLGRYDALLPGDMAILGFDEGIVPSKVDMYLIREAATPDAAIHAHLSAMMGGRGMIELPEGAIATLIAAAPRDHPLRDIGTGPGDVTLEEAALGSSVAIRRLSGRRARPRSAEELREALERARVIGRKGEALVFQHLRSRQDAGEITGLRWDADVNAVNAWDISFTDRDSVANRVEVKATTNAHDRTIHISQAEIESASELEAPETQVWRVSFIDDDGGVLRRSTNLRELANEIGALTATMRDGIVPDGWSVDPTCLDWDAPITLRFDRAAS